MLHGECMIVLQDVTVQFGLSINNRALTRLANYNWTQLCYDLLGVETNDNVLKGCYLSLPWLTQQFDNFSHLLEDVDENQVQHSMLEPTTVH